MSIASYWGFTRLYRAAFGQPRAAVPPKAVRPPDRASVPFDSITWLRLGDGGLAISLLHQGKAMFTLPEKYLLPGDVAQLSGIDGRLYLRFE